MEQQAHKAGGLLTACYISFALITGICNSRGSTPGIFDGNSDIGSPKLPGSVNYDRERQEYTLQGSGENIWFNKDDFHFLWKSLEKSMVPLLLLR